MEPTEEGKKKPQGFAAFTPEKRREAQSKGGSAKVPKGIGTLSEEARRENASRAASIRWQRVREERLKNEANAQRQDNRDTPGQEAHQEG